MGIFAEYSSFCVLVSPADLFLSAITHSTSLIPPCLLLFSLLPPVSLFFTNSPNCIALSVSVLLCYPTQTVLSPSVFLPPNLLFVLRRLQHSLVMFFFLRSHFRTSEGEQEKIGLRKPAVKGSSAPFALQISAQHSETFRPSSSLSEKQVVSRSTCLVSLFDASIPSELPQPPAPNLPDQGLVSRDVIGWSRLLFLILLNTSPHYIPLIVPLHFHLWSPISILPDSHTHPHTLVDTLQLHYTEWKEFQMSRGGPLLVSHGCRRGRCLNLHKMSSQFFSLESERNFLFLLVNQVVEEETLLAYREKIKKDPAALFNIQCVKEQSNAAFISLEKSHKVLLIIIFVIWESSLL